MSNDDLLAPVTEVRHVVRRRAAHVHRHAPADARHEVDLRALRRCRRSGAPVEATDRAPAASLDIASRQPRASSATAHTAMPSARPIAPRPSPRLGRTDDVDPVPHRLAAPARARRPGSPPSPRRAARAGAARPRPRRRRCRPTSRSLRDPPRDVGEQLDRVGVAVAARRSRGTACRGRAARPGRAARRRPRARPRRRRSDRRAAARPRSARRRARAAASSPNGMHVEAEPDPVPHGAGASSSSACASSRSSATRELEVAALALDDHDGPAVRLDERGVVGVDRRRPRARRAARRRGTPAASAPRPDRRAAPSRPPGRRRPASPCRTTGSAGHRAVGAGRDRRDHRARTARATRAAAPRRARRRCRRRRERARARPAPSRSASRRPVAVAHAGGRVPLDVGRQHDDDAVARLPRDTDRAVEHASRHRAGANCFARAEARAAPGRDDDRPGRRTRAHTYSPARRVPPSSARVSRRGGRTRGGRRSSARPT